MAIPLHFTKCVNPKGHFFPSMGTESGKAQQRPLDKFGVLFCSGIISADGQINNGSIVFVRQLCKELWTHAYKIVACIKFSLGKMDILKKV